MAGSSAGGLMLGLLSRYPVICSSLCISLKDGALEDETYGCKFLHALRWLNLKIGEKDDNHRNNHQGRVTCYIPSESNIISIYHFHCSENIQKMFWKTFYDIKLRFEKNHHLRKITCSRINPNGLRPLYTGLRPSCHPCATTKMVRTLSGRRNPESSVSV